MKVKDTEALNDLRNYLTQVITALRWMKDRQLRISAYTWTAQVALLATPAEEMFGADICLWLSGGLSALLLGLIAEHWRQLIKTRQREKLIIEHLSDTLNGIIQSTITSRKWEKFSKFRWTDLLYFGPHAGVSIVLVVFRSAKNGCFAPIA